MDLGACNHDNIPVKMAIFGPSAFGAEGVLKHCPPQDLPNHTKTPPQISLTPSSKRSLNWTPPKNCCCCGCCPGLSAPPINPPCLQGGGERRQKEPGPPPHHSASRSEAGRGNSRWTAHGWDGKRPGRPRKTQTSVGAICEELSQLIRGRLDVAETAPKRS